MDEIIVKLTVPTDADREQFRKTLGSAEMLNNRVKIVAIQNGHSAELFMLESDVKRLGSDYIRNHITIQYSSFCEEWFIKISENDYYNDPQRNPEQVIFVKFVGLQRGTGMEIYRSKDGFYLREVSSRENFSKWYYSGKKLKSELEREVRANTIFDCEGQREKVLYDDWNGVAAYETTRTGEKLHNKNFLVNYFKKHKRAQRDYLEV